MELGYQSLAGVREMLAAAGPISQVVSDLAGLAARDGATLSLNEATCSA